MCCRIGMYAYKIVTGTLLMIMTWNNTWKHFLKDQLFFGAHLKFILGCSQSRNQGEGAKGASAPFS